jgi:hypothetical protein
MSVRDLFPSGSPTKLFTHVSIPMPATCPVHLTLFQFIFLITYGAGYKVTSSSLWNFRQSPIISSPLGPPTPLSSVATTHTITLTLKTLQSAESVVMSLVWFP